MACSLLSPGGASASAMSVLLRGLGAGAAFGGSAGGSAGGPVEAAGTVALGLAAWAA